MNHFSSPNTQILQAVRRSRSKAFCVFCQKQVELVTTIKAEQYLQTDPHTANQLIEAENIHRIHNSKGIVMICETSLKKFVKSVRAPQIIVLKPLS